MKINNVSALYYNNTYKLQVKKGCSVDIANNNYGVSSYPNAYYTNQISFGSLTGLGLVKKIGEENFPSPKIVQALKDIGNNYNYSLPQIHLDNYKELLGCNTLEEAKEKYPEFTDVIDAKDVDTEVYEKITTLKKIANNEIEGLNIGNLSIELLKRYYGKLYSVKSKKEYFNLSNNTIEKLFDALNIKKFNKIYAYTIAFSDPEHKKKVSENSKKVWASDDGTRREEARKNAAVVLTSPENRAKNKLCMQTQEHREKVSKETTDSWASDDGTRREEARKQAIINFHSPEIQAKRLAALRTEDHREKLSKSLCEFREKNPKYTEALKLAWEKHPEITDKMSEIADSFPSLPEIIEKKEQGIVLTKKEKEILLGYYKACEQAMPDHKKTIGKEYHNILVEWGLIEE